MDYRESAIGKINEVLDSVRSESVDAMAPAKPVQATVYRVVDGKAYVKTDGDDVEKGPFEMSVEATAGNRVALTNLGGTWAVTDNLTSPCTDDSRANAAWDYADSAKTAADQAGTAASNAATAAANAQTSANNAATAASNAQSSANAAAEAASIADGKAVAASNAAAIADGKAVAAGNSAQQANTYALGALSSLAELQDVIGVLNWAAENAEFALTSDTSIVPGKVYWTRGGTAPDYTYTPIANPVESGLPSYYEVDSVDDAMGDYISSHLALDNSGLTVLQDASGYRLRISSQGWYIIDPYGVTVNQATGSGSDVGPTSGRHIHVGSSSIDMMNGANVDGWSIGSALQLIKSGVSYIWAGLENAVSLVRVGLASAGNVVMSGDGYVDVRHGSEVTAHFGYGPGNAQSGTDTAPYYTLGKRYSNSAIGNYSVAEGYNATASGACSHAEGDQSTASAYQSHAEGGRTTASGIAAHSQGTNTTASGNNSHAEGGSTTASGSRAHAEGSQTTASGNDSHAGGVSSVAGGAGSFAHGKGVKTDASNQFAVGTFNDLSTSGVFTVGIGSDDTHRANGFVVGSAGVAYAKGGVMSDGAIQGTSISDGTGTLAQLRESVSSKLPMHVYSFRSGRSSVKIKIVGSSDQAFFVALRQWQVINYGLWYVTGYATGANLYRIADIFNMATPTLQMTGNDELTLTVSSNVPSTVVIIPLLGEQTVE